MTKRNYEKQKLEKLRNNDKEENEKQNLKEKL